MQTERLTKKFQISEQVKTEQMIPHQEVASPESTIKIK
jgi:hypothetical protein